MRPPAWPHRLWTRRSIAALRDAAAAPPESLAYVVAFDRAGQRPDALTVVDVDEYSASYGQVVGWTDLPGPRRRAAPLRLERLQQRAQARGPRHGDGLARRYLLRARPAIVDTSTSTTPSPTRAHRTLVKTIDADELAAKAGYSRPHTLHCGPDGVFLTCLGDGTGDGDGPGGIALLDHNTFDVLRSLGDTTAARSTWPTTPGGTSTRTR